MTSPPATHRSVLPLWVAVAAGGAVVAISLGVRSTFGLLLDPIAEGIGTGTAPIAFAIAIQNLLWGLSQPIAGAVSDRYGPARTLAAGGVLYSVALLLMASADSSTMVLLSGGFLAGMSVGAASFAVVLSAIGRMAPPEKRSLLLGLVSAVGSIGQFVLIPTTRVLLDRYSWETTTIVLAGIAAVVVIVAPGIRARPMAVEASDSESSSAAHSSVTLRAELRRAGSSRSYLMLNAAFLVCGFHVTYIGVFLPGYIDDRGVSAASASTALALIGLFNVFGSLLAGWLGQRRSPTMILAAIYGLRALVIAVYLVVPITAASTIVFGMAMGLLWLATVPLTSAIVTQQFGPTHAGTLFGIVFLSHQIGSFIGAWMGGEMVDATGSYLPMWWTAVGLGVIAMLLHLLIDEGPVPEPPTGRRPVGLAPAGIAAVIVVAGVSAAAATLTTDTAQAAATRATHCVLPVVDTS